MDNNQLLNDKIEQVKRETTFVFPNEAWNNFNMNFEVKMSYLEYLLEAYKERERESIIKTPEEEDDEFIDEVIIDGIEKLENDPFIDRAYEEE